MPIKQVRPPNRGRRSIPVTLPAPLGGLNGRDSLAEMPHNEAFHLDNWFPNSTSVDTRGGSKDHITGLGVAIESLAAYTGATAGTPKMLAFGGGNIYDVTVPGAPTTIATGKLSSRVTTTMFSNAGVQVLLIYTGQDAPMSYDGATLTNLTITGLTGSQNSLVAGMGFKGRLFLTQANMLGFYYLAVGAIQGPATYFDLTQQCLKGGQLDLICTYSQDSGNGPQDFCLFVTSEGEYILYSGTDPSSAANWSLVGKAFGPPLANKRAVIRFRSDVYFITEEGLLSAQQIREKGENTEGTEYITAKLGRHYTDLQPNFGTHGLSGMIYPRGGALMVNVPLTGTITGPYCQFLMNTSTNAWCRFTGWNGISWVLFNRRLYFGTADGRVVLADDGYMDNGVPVPTTARQAWNTFDDEHGMGEAEKHFHFATFAVQADGIPSIACSLNVNFTDENPPPAPPAISSAHPTWDVTAWDESYWAEGSSTQHITVPIGKIGYTGSLWLNATSTAEKIRWMATRVILEKTKGVLLE